MNRGKIKVLFFSNGNHFYFYIYTVNISQYFRNVSLLFVVNFAIKPLWVFGVERKFQLILGQENYGQYFNYLQLIYILSILLDMGLHSYTVKSIAEKNHHNATHWASLLKSKCILVILYLAVVFIAIILKGLSISNAIIFLLVAIEMLTFSIYQFLRCFAQGLQWMRLDSFLSVLDRILLILLGLGLLILYNDGLTPTLEQFIGFHILAYSVCFVGLMVLLSKKLKFNIGELRHIPLYTIIREAFPLLVITLLMSIYTRVDALFLEYLLPNKIEQSGVLAFSNRFVDSAYNALYLLSVFLLPSIAFRNAQNDTTYIRKVVWISFIACTTLSVGFIICSHFFGNYLYNWLYHTTNIEAIRVFKIQSWTALGVGWMYVFGSYLTATSRYKPLILIVSIGVLLSFIFNLYLVPKWEVLGSAYTSLIVHITMGVLHSAVAFYFLSKSTINATNR